MAATVAGCAQSEPSRQPAHPAAAEAVHRAVGDDVPRLRLARMDDLAALLRLEAGFPGDRLRPRQMRHHLTSPAAQLWVADAGGGQLAGYLLLLWHPRRRDGRIYSLVVDPAWRGRGVARALIAAARRQALARPPAGLRLEVREDNAAALALYRAEGFVAAGQRADYYEDGAAAACLRWHPAESHRTQPGP